jgi:predicted branched-subunit amino acid permease
MNMQTKPPDIAFTRAGIVAGMVAGQALAAGVLVYGLVFGVLASEAQLTAVEAFLMSGFIYSGTAQMAALQGWAHTRLLLPAIATILIMNARYVLYGAALRPWMGTLPPHVTYPSLFFLADGNWALSMQRRAAGESDAGFVLGSGLVMFVPWLIGTLAGNLLGSAPFPTRRGSDSISCWWRFRRRWASRYFAAVPIFAPPSRPWWWRCWSTSSSPAAGPSSRPASPARWSRTSPSTR